MDPLKDLPDVIDDDSSPSDESTPPDAVVAEPDKGTEAPKKEGRTIDQLHGEFHRKFSKLTQQISTVLDRIEKFETQHADAPSKAPENSIDNYTVEQLKGLRGQVTEEAQKTQLEDIIRQRETRDILAKELSTFKSTSEFTQIKQQADTTAVRRFPDLKKEESEFYQEVRHRIRLRGQTHSTQNPRVVLDVANQVAIHWGVTPKSAPKRIRGTTATRQNTNTPSDKPKTSMSKEEAGRIAERLQHALPKGKKFDLDKITERHALYRDNLDIMTK